MIRAEFFTRGGTLCGFRIGGHSMAAESGSDIVCAAVSSAAYLTANTVTDVIGADAEASVQESGTMVLKVSLKDAGACLQVLEGFRRHMEALREQYPENITVKITEV